MSSDGFQTDSSATRDGIRESSSCAGPRAQAPAPANPTRPDPESGRVTEAEGNRRGNPLIRYLGAPEEVRSAFDRFLVRTIGQSLDDERALLDDVGDDPLFDASRLPSTVDVRWDARWDRRAAAARRPVPPGQRRYSRETDPLLDLDLREVWEELTDERLTGAVARCPSPDHDDRWPSCTVRERLFFCNGCEANGSIIDLGRLLYGIEPRGAGFHELRGRLLAALGMEDR